MKVLTAYALASAMLFALVARAEEQDELVLDPEIMEASEATLEELSSDIKMPKQRVLKGTKRLLCIGVKYTNVEKVVGKNGCQYAADRIAEYYERNSRGLLQIQATGMEPFAVGMKGNSTSYKKAVEMIKAKYPTYHYYVIPGIYTYPHAGGKVAHVKSAQLMTAFHEVGHLLGLGHSGNYVIEKGKSVLKAYGDTDSIMGRIISRYITAPQYYYLGWLRNDEIAVYSADTEFYDLRTNGEYKQKGLATVIIHPSVMKENGYDQERFAFISRSKCDNGKTCISLHLANGGGSQKVAEVGKEFYDSRFTGIHAKLLSNENGKFRVAIDFDKKPE